MDAFNGCKNEGIVAKNETMVQNRTYFTNIYSYMILSYLDTYFGVDNSLLVKWCKDYFLKHSKMENDSNIIVYNNGNISIDVKVSPIEETVWLNQKQIADLFETT